MRTEARARSLFAPENPISPYDQAVIDFRTALVDPTPDFQLVLERFKACESFAPKMYNYRLERVSVEANNAWELRGLTFEAETAALRRGDTTAADSFKTARHFWEEELVTYDPQDMPKIKTLPPFEGQQELLGRKKRHFSPLRQQR